MGAICFGNIGLGLCVGLIFSLLFVTFDSAWKKVLSLGINLKYIYKDYDSIARYIKSKNPEA